MLSRVILPLMVFAASGLVSLALVWPQGMGARSPAPFGHPVAAAATPGEQAKDLARKAGLRSVR